MSLTLVCQLRLPHTCATIGPQAAKAGLVPAPPGGLFVARKGLHADELIISASQKADEFSKLLAEPVLKELTKGDAEASTFIELLTMWSRPRFAGTLADHQRRRVIECIRWELTRRLCGHHWAYAERAFIRSAKTEKDIDNFKLAVQSNSFAAALKLKASELGGKDAPSREIFFQIASRYGECDDRGLSDFALFWAQEPHRLSALCGDQLGALLSALPAKPRCCGARGWSPCSVAKRPPR